MRDSSSLTSLVLLQVALAPSYVLWVSQGNIRLPTEITWIIEWPILMCVLVNQAANYEWVSYMDKLCSIDPASTTSASFSVALENCCSPRRESLLWSSDTLIRFQFYFQKSLLM